VCLVAGLLKPSAVLTRDTWTESLSKLGKDILKLHLMMA
jgi:hypothetical protein